MWPTGEYHDVKQCVRPNEIGTLSINVPHDSRPHTSSDNSMPFDIETNYEQIISEFVDHFGDVRNELRWLLFGWWDKGMNSTQSSAPTYGKWRIVDTTTHDTHSIRMQCVPFNLLDSIRFSMEYKSTYSSFTFSDHRRKEIKFHRRVDVFSFCTCTSPSSPYSASQQIAETICATNKNSRNKSRSIKLVPFCGAVKIANSLHFTSNSLSLSLLLWFLRSCSLAWYGSRLTSICWVHTIQMAWIIDHFICHRIV